jgi:hypothetical protein
MISVVGVLAYNQLVDQHYEFHTLSTQNDFKFIRIRLIITMQALKIALERVNGTYD